MLADAIRRAAKRGIQGILEVLTVIGTGSSSTTTAYFNQRKSDRCQNGVLWSFWGSGNSGTACWGAWSTDNGLTWSTPALQFAFHNGSTVVNHVPNASFFIDVDDYAHVAYKNSQDGKLYYRRGTPNAARTAWTWSGAVEVAAGSDRNYPDIVAHPDEGGGWKAHVVVSSATSISFVWYYPIDISSSGAVTVGTAVDLHGTSYDNAEHKWPSIDFNHIGDSKTVAGGTPHLYVAWSAGATGSGKGIRFKKATYSAGSWTWGTEREIDSTRYIADSYHWLNCLFDGTRVVMGGFLKVSTTWDLVVYERDAADTTTTARALLTSTALADRLFSGGMTYDGDANVYLFGRNADEAAGTYDLVYRKWTRSTTTLGSEVVIDAGVGDTPFLSAKRGYSNNRIEFIYTDGSADPYNVTFGGIR